MLDDTIVGAAIETGGVWSPALQTLVRDLADRYRTAAGRLGGTPATGKPP